jgi:hypothetical protein
MSYNGAGAFVINTAGQPVITGTVISSTAFNALTADLATGLSTAITKDGQTATTARIPFAAGISSTLVTDSTSVSTGSIITAGGAGIAKALYVGTTANVAGASTFTGAIAVDSVTDSSSTTTGSIQTDGGLGVAKAVFIGTTLNVASTATATKLIPTGTSATGNGLYLPAANALGLSTNGTNAVYIDASQNVGIGTSSPSAKLTVAGSVTVTGTNAIAASSCTMTIGDATRTASTSTTTGAIVCGGGLGVWADIYAGGLVSASKLIPTGTSATGNGLYLPAANSLGFSTNGTEAVRIDSNQNLLINTTSVSAVGSRISVKGSTVVWGCGPTSGSDSFFVYNASQVGVYLGNGSTSWSSSSDERVKTAVTPFENALEKVCTLRAGTGRYLTDEESVSRSFLIAQDVQAVLPEAVNVQDDEIGTLGLQYTDVIPLLVAAIQEQQALITALTARITALETP